MNKCVIISGAPTSKYSFLSDKISNNSFIICADSGYESCVKAGLSPNLIIGDFDSSIKPNLDCEIIALNKEKAYTDTFHCVIEAHKRGFDYIEIYCAIGSRLDHSYANILCLNYCVENNIKCFIISDKNRISIIKDYAKIYKDYENFSLFAFMSNCCGVKIKGAYYTAGFYDKESLDFNIDSQFGVSNYVIDEYAEIFCENGLLLLIESND